jgi:hypothetical protein
VYHIVIMFPGGARLGGRYESAKAAEDAFSRFKGARTTEALDAGDAPALDEARALRRRVVKVVDLGPRVADAAVKLYRVPTSAAMAKYGLNWGGE